MKLQEIKEEMIQIIIDVLSYAGHFSLNRCCILMNYEPEIPSELEEFIK